MKFISQEFTTVFFGGCGLQIVFVVVYYSLFLMPSAVTFTPLHKQNLLSTVLPVKKAAVSCQTFGEIKFVVSDFCEGVPVMQLI